MGLALQASGARMSRQVRFLREGLEDQTILENAKGEEGLSRAQLEARIVVPHHTILLQIFPLYVLPVIIIVAGYFFKLLGFFVTQQCPVALLRLPGPGYRKCVYAANTRSSAFAHSTDARPRTGSPG